MALDRRHNLCQFTVMPDPRATGSPARSRLMADDFAVACSGKAAVAALFPEATGRSVLVGDRSALLGDRHVTPCFRWGRI